MPTQLLKLGLQNASDLSQTQVLSIFQEGAEDASRQVIDISANESIIENERAVITSKNYNVMASGLFSAASRTQLQTWASDGTELKLSGFGLDGSILQGDRAITAKTGLEDNASLRIMSNEEAVGGYNSTTGKHSSDISYCKNALALYKWQEGATSGVAAGWTADGTLDTTTFSGGSQTIAESSASDSELYRDIYFPFPNKQIGFTIDVSAATVTGSAAVEIIAYNSSGSAIGSTSTTAIDSTGEFDVLRTLPAGTEYIRVQVRVNDASVTFSNPSVYLGSTYVFEEFNT